MFSYNVIQPPATPNIPQLPEGVAMPPLRASVPSSVAGGDLSMSPVSSIPQSMVQLAEQAGLRFSRTSIRPGLQQSSLSQTFPGMAASTPMGMSRLAFSASSGTPPTSSMSQPVTSLSQMVSNLQQHVGTPPRATTPAANVSHPGTPQPAATPQPPGGSPDSLTPPLSNPSNLSPGQHLKTTSPAPGRLSSTSPGQSRPTTTSPGCAPILSPGQARTTTSPGHSRKASSPGQSRLINTSPAQSRAASSSPRQSHQTGASPAQSAVHTLSPEQSSGTASHYTSSSLGSLTEQESAAKVTTHVPASVAVATGTPKNETASGAAQKVRDSKSRRASGGDKIPQVDGAGDEYMCSDWIPQLDGAGDEKPEKMEVPVTSKESTTSETPAVVMKCEEANDESDDESRPDAKPIVFGSKQFVHDYAKPEPSVFAHIPETVFMSASCTIGLTSTNATSSATETVLSAAASTKPPITGVCSEKVTSASSFVGTHTTELGSSVTTSVLGSLISTSSETIRPSTLHSFMSVSKAATATTVRPTGITHLEWKSPTTQAEGFQEELSKTHPVTEAANMDMSSTSLGGKVANFEASRNTQVFAPSLSLYRPYEERPSSGILSTASSITSSGMTYTSQTLSTAAQMSVTHSLATTLNLTSIAPTATASMTSIPKMSGSTFSNYSQYPSQVKNETTSTERSEPEKPQSEAHVIAEVRSDPEVLTMHITGASDPDNDHKNCEHPGQVIETDKEELGVCDPREQPNEPTTGRVKLQFTFKKTSSLLVGKMQVSLV